MPEEDPTQAQTMAGVCLVSGPTRGQEVQCGKDKGKQSISLGPNQLISCYRKGFLEVLESPVSPTVSSGK